MLVFKRQSEKRDPLLSNRIFSAVKEKIALRQRSALTIQRYLRGWLVRKHVGYYTQVNRAVRNMTKELNEIREAYSNLPEYQSKGYANVGHSFERLQLFHLF